MSTATERETTAETVREAITLACGDNAPAAAYLTLVAHVARMFDDLEDGDGGPVDIGQLAYLLLVALPRNTFFAQHSSHLVPLHDAAVNAWQDANQMDPDGRLVATRFWADWVNEIACVVSGLAGGYHHRRNVSPRIRMLLYPDWDEESDKGIVARDEPLPSTRDHNHSPLTTNP